MPLSPEQRLAAETYLGRVQALVIEQDWLTPEEHDQVRHLVEHGEPAEGLRELAWIIARRRQRVAAEVICAIRRDTEGWSTRPTCRPTSTISLARADGCPG